MFASVRLVTASHLDVTQTLPVDGNSQKACSVPVPVPVTIKINRRSLRQAKDK
jgi:hypothetical protein